MAIFVSFALESVYKLIHYIIYCDDNDYSTEL